MASLTVIFIILAIPFIFAKYSDDKSNLYSYYFVIALHQAVAFINRFYFTVVGADIDAIGFSRSALEIAESGNFYFVFGSKFFENFLGFLYWLFGPSHFLGGQFSILAFAFSCILLLKILEQLDLSRYGAIALLAFGALPTMVLMGSITIRESYQLLFFMSSVYFGIRLHQQGGINSNLIYMFISVALMGLFHRGLLVYSLFLIPLLILFSINPNLKFLQLNALRFLSLLFVPFFVLAILFLGESNISGTKLLNVLLNSDVRDYLTYVRGKSVVSRASYGLLVDFSSFIPFLYSLFLIYVYYLFAPFPWDVSNILDVYATIEGLLRFLLLYCSIRQYLISKGEQRRLFGLLMILFFSMTFMWALGTTNYGQAMRHHMLTWWILVVLGVPYLVNSLSSYRYFSFIDRFLIDKNLQNKKS